MATKNNTGNFHLLDKDSFLRYRAKFDDGDLLTPWNFCFLAGGCHPPKGDSLELMKLGLTPPFLQVRNNRDPDVTARINALPPPVKRAVKKLQAACAERLEAWPCKEKPETFREICKAAKWKPDFLKYVPHKPRRKPGLKKQSAISVNRRKMMAFIRERVGKTGGAISAKQLRADSAKRHGKDIFAAWSWGTLATRLSGENREYRLKHPA